MFLVFLLIGSLSSHEALGVLNTTEGYKTKAECEIAKVGYMNGFNQNTSMNHGDMVVMAAVCDTKENYDKKVKDKAAGQDI